MLLLKGGIRIYFTYHNNLFFGNLRYYCLFFQMGNSSPLLGKQNCNFSLLFLSASPVFCSRFILGVFSTEDASTIDVHVLFLIETSVNLIDIKSEVQKFRDAFAVNFNFSVNYQDHTSICGM